MVAHVFDLISTDIFGCELRRPRSPRQSSPGSGPSSNTTRSDYSIPILPTARDYGGSSTRPPPNRSSSRCVPSFKRRWMSCSTGSRGQSKWTSFAILPSHYQRDLEKRSVQNDWKQERLDPARSIKASASTVRRCRGGLDRGSRVLTCEIVDANYNLKLWKMTTVGVRHH